jgi:microcystin-dependent protein
MARTFLFANLARSSLAGGITNTATSLAVQSGGGAQFPSPSPSEQFALTLTDAATGLLKEIVYCTARPGFGDTLTVVRGQEGYTALNWTAGDPIANLWTAGQARSMVQQGQQQQQPENICTDSGTVNAYIGIYDPAIVSVVLGMPLRIRISNTNTGPSTFNPGSGAVAIVNGAGQPLNAGELRAGLVYELMWNGTNYEIIGPSGQSIPTGSIFPFAASVAPSGGWLVCNGASVLRATYPNLNAVMAADGYPYGFADGTHFNLPDLRGRVPAGIDGAASRLSSATMTPDGDTLGAVGGTEQVTLNTTQIPSHNHAITDPGHLHELDMDVGNLGGVGVGLIIQQGTLVNTHVATTGITIANTGGGLAHLNVQPTLLVNYIIKT